MKNLREYRLYTVFLLMILLMLLFEVLLSKPEKSHQMSIIEVPRIDQMLIDFPCNVYITKSSDETIVFDGKGEIERQFIPDEGRLVLHLKESPRSITARFRQIMLSGDPKPNLYVRISDPRKIVPNGKLTLITSEALSCQSSGLLSSIENLRKLLRSSLQIG